MIIRAVRDTDCDEWLRMRMALWPDGVREDLESELAEITANRPQEDALMLERPEGGLGGFVEVALRPWAEGCRTRPVGYIEGWYVDPDLRRQGWGRALVAAAEAWARQLGCREMGSDCELWNDASFQAHQALGYEEVLRTIHFRRSLS